MQAGRCSYPWMNDRTMSPDPVNRLLAHYRGIAGRMRGLPLYNPRLRVETVGFAPYQGDSLGALITPWTLNLILLPAEGIAAQGETRTVTLPGGDYRFLVSTGAGPPHLSLPLFTTVTDFPDQATARAVALETLARLRRPTKDVEDTTPSIDRPLQRPVTRRAVLARILPVSGDA